MRVLIVDDQTLIRDGLVTICQRLPDVDVVATAGDGQQALAAVGEHAPDVVLMDLRMPRMDGIEAARVITAEHPRTHVVVLTTYSDDEGAKAQSLGFRHGSGADQVGPYGVVTPVGARGMEAAYN